MFGGFPSHVMNRSVVKALCDALQGVCDGNFAYEEVPQHTVSARQDEQIRYVFLLRSAVSGWRA